MGPGRGEVVVRDGRVEARSDGTAKPENDRDNRWTGGGTKDGFVGLSESPGEGETSARAIV